MESWNLLGVFVYLFVCVCLLNLCGIAHPAALMCNIEFAAHFEWGFHYATLDCSLVCLRQFVGLELNLADPDSSVIQSHILESIQFLIESYWTFSFSYSSTKYN